MSKALGLIAVVSIVLMATYLEIWVRCAQIQETRGSHDLLVNTGCTDAAD